MKLQHYTGNELLLEKLDELDSGSNKRIVTKDIYQTLIQDPEIKNKIVNDSNVTDEELSLMGFKPLSEVLAKTGVESVGFGFSAIGEKIDNEIQSIGNRFKAGSEILKKGISNRKFCRFTDS